VIEFNDGCNPIIKRSSSVKFMTSGIKGECLFLLGKSWKVVKCVPCLTTIKRILRFMAYGTLRYKTFKEKKSTCNVSSLLIMCLFYMHCWWLALRNVSRRLKVNKKGLLLPITYLLTSKQGKYYLWKQFSY
jgi:hypothetical protein